MDRNENLILYGRNGAGKSHMTTAVGVEACMQEKKVRFNKTAALVNELTDAKSEGSLTKLLNKLSKLDLLICNEWGCLPFDAEGSQLLFQVIADCYEKTQSDTYNKYRIQQLNNSLGCYIFLCILLHFGVTKYNNITKKYEY